MQTNVAIKVLYLILAFSAMTVNSKGQQEDLFKIFWQNKSKAEFKISNSQGQLYFGHIFADKDKSALILQKSTQNDRDLLIYLMSEDNGQWTRKFIDTVEIGIALTVQFENLDDDNDRDLTLLTSDNRSWEYYLTYNEIKKSLMLLKGLEYPDLLAIKDYPDYHWNFMSIGCADAEKVSYLVKIDNGNYQEIGRIYFHGCEDEENTVEIEIGGKKK